MKDWDQLFKNFKQTCQVLQTRLSRLQNIQLKKQILTALKNKVLYEEYEKAQQIVASAVIINEEEKADEEESKYIQGVKKSLQHCPAGISDTDQQLAQATYEGLFGENEVSLKGYPPAIYHFTQTLLLDIPDGLAEQPESGPTVSLPSDSRELRLLKSLNYQQRRLLITEAITTLDQLDRVLRLKIGQRPDAAVQQYEQRREVPAEETIHEQWVRKLWPDLASSQSFSTNSLLTQFNLHQLQNTEVSRETDATLKRLQRQAIAARTEEVLREIEAVKTGQRLINELNVEGSLYDDEAKREQLTEDEAQSLAQADVYCVSDLASMTLEQLQEKVDIQEERLKRYKLLANLQEGAFVSPRFARLLETIEISEIALDVEADQQDSRVRTRTVDTLTMLARQDVDYLASELTKRLEDDLEDDEKIEALIKALETVHKRVLLFLESEKHRFTDHHRQLAQSTMDFKEAVRSYRQAKANGSDNDAKAAKEVIIFATTGAWVKQAKLIEGIVFWPPFDVIVSPSCECDWEDSIFSEKAYLVYLSQTFEYGYQEIKLLGVDLKLGDVDKKIVKSGCKSLTKVQQAILVIQEDLRKRPEQNLIPKDFNNPGERFLDYEEWLAYTIRQAFPENSMQDVLGNVGFPLFPGNSVAIGNQSLADLLGVYATRTKEINTFSQALRGTIPRILLEEKIRVTQDELEEKKFKHNDLSGKSWGVRKVSNSLLLGIPFISVLRLEQENPSIERFFPYRFSLDDTFHQYQKSILAESFNRIKTLLHFYSTTHICLRIAFGLKEWTQAIPFLGDVLRPVGQPIPGVQRLFGEVIDQLKGVREYGRTLGVEYTKTLMETYEALRSEDNSAYPRYKSHMRQMRDIFHEHEDRVKTVVKCTFPLASALGTYKDSFFAGPMEPESEQFYEVSRWVLLDRIRVALSNEFRVVNQAGHRVPMVKYSNSYGESITELTSQTVFDDDSVYYNFLFILKLFDSPFLYDETLYELSNDYSKYFYAFNENVTDLGLNDNIRSAREFLSSNDRIKQRLQVMVEPLEGGEINAKAIGQLYFNLLNHLPYIRFFILPYIYASYEFSQNDHEAAVIWLSFIFDHIETSQFILPFELTTSEKNAVRLILGEIWLDWAEVLFREDTYESIQHAKELYQKVHRLFSEYHCCDDSIRQRMQHATLSMMAREDIPLGVKQNFHELMQRASRRHLSNPVLAEEITRLSQLPGDHLSQALTNFTTENAKALLPDSSMQRHWAAHERFVEKGKDKEWEFKVTVEAVDSSLGEFYTFNRARINRDKLPQVTSSGRLLTMDDLSGALEVKETPKEALQQSTREMRITSSLDIYKLLFIPVEFDLCSYPNPRVVAMLNAACQYLGYIEQCRNFIGYRQDDVSIYTYDELIRKARHYIQLAIHLEQDYIRYRENFEREQQEQFKAWQSVLRDHAQAALGDLQLQEAKEMAKLANLQHDRAVQVRGNLQAEIDFRNSPAGVFVRLTHGMQRNYGVYSSISHPIAGAIAAAQDLTSQIIENVHEDDKLDRDLAVLDTDVAIAAQNQQVTAVRVDIARAQQTIYQIDLKMDSLFLQLLRHQVLGEEAYAYMLQRAKQMYKAYMDMAIQFSWLAERQLEFLRGVELNAIRFSYYTSDVDDKETALLLAAETLQKDLERLNYEKELSERNRVVCKKTFSLRQGASLRFARFLETGTMRFRTTADYLSLETERVEVDGVMQTRLTADPYKGHSQYPDHYGHLQQRIVSVELRLLALLGSDQDIHMDLANLGTSMVMVERESKDSAEPQFVPVILRRPYEKVVFNRAVGEDTGQVYVFRAAEGVLRPFETVGLETSWELNLDPRTNRLDLWNIYDIQFVINYTAQYNSRYALAQQERDETTNEYKRLPNQLTRMRVYSFKQHFPDAYYRLMNPTYPFPGSRDLRFLTFATNAEQLGPNEQEGQKIKDIRFYVQSRTKLTSFECTISNTKELTFFRSTRTQFENRFNDPTTNTTEEVDGLVDYSDLKNTPPQRHLSQLFSDQENERDIQRQWSIKFFPTTAPEAYRKKDIAGASLTTRDQPEEDKTTDVLRITANTDDKTFVSLNAPNLQTHLASWDNYSVQFKCKLMSGSAQLRWRVDPEVGRGFYLTLSEQGITVGADGSPEVVIDNGVQLVVDEWYQLEVLSYNKTDDSNNNIVQVKLGGLVIWRGELSFVTTKPFGYVSLGVRHTLMDSESHFSDLLVQKIDHQGRPTQRLFVDTFDGTQQHAWQGLDSPSVELIASDNPALDLSNIEDITMEVDYSYQPRI